MGNPHTSDPERYGWEVRLYERPLLEDQVGSLLTDDVESVALDDYDSYCIIYRNGGFSCSSPAVSEMLKARPSTAPKPCYAALGSKGRYFVKFVDGSFVGEFGDAELSEIVCDSDSNVDNVRFVAFGPTPQFWALVHDDGIHFGRDVPPGVQRDFEVREDDWIESCSLGADGQHFVRYRDGQFRIGYGEMLFSSRLKDFVRFFENAKKFMSEDEQDDTLLRDVVWGQDGSWVVKYAA